MASYNDVPFAARDVRSSLDAQTKEDPQYNVSQNDKNGVEAVLECNS
jgi:hypothetical protein